MIIRKILAQATVAVILSTPAISNLYLGGQIGGTQMHGTVYYNDLNLQQSTESRLRGIGFAYGLQVGYIHYLSKSHVLFLCEAFYVKEPMRPKSTNLNFQSNSITPGILTVRPTNNYGVALGMGMFLNPKFDLYLKVGYENKGLNTTYTLPEQPQSTPGTVKSVWAIAPGAGFSFKITPSISINPEYTYVIGKNYKVLPQTTNSDGTYSKNIYFSPNEQRLMLKFNYILG